MIVKCFRVKYSLISSTKLHTSRCDEFNFDKNLIVFKLQDAVLSGKCPISDMRDYLRCASNDRNNTYCCYNKNVLNGGRDVCEPFCNVESDNWPERADGKYLRCITQFDSIMKCHWASARL